MIPKFKFLGLGGNRETIHAKMKEDGQKTTMDESSLRSCLNTFYSSASGSDEKTSVGELKRAYDAVVSHKGSYNIPLALPKWEP